MKELQRYIAMIKKFHLFDKVTHNVNITNGELPRDTVKEKRTLRTKTFTKRIGGNEIQGNEIGLMNQFRMNEKWIRHRIGCFFFSFSVKFTTFQMV